MKCEFVICHWILTLLCGPVIFIIVRSTNDSNLNNLFSPLEIYPVMLIMGLIFSLPTYIFYYFVFNNIKDKGLKIIYEKMTLVIIVVSGIFITTALINGTLWFDISVSYSISSIIIGLSFNFKDEEENVQ